MVETMGTNQALRNDLIAQLQDRRAKIGDMIQATSNMADATEILGMYRQLQVGLTRDELKILTLKSMER